MKNKKLLAHANRLLDRLENLLPPPPPELDWGHQAFRWQAHDSGGRLRPVRHPHRTQLDDLLCMDRQKSEVIRNTELFLQGRPANNILLWGSRGTGKSTLIKAAFNAYADRGLRLIEIEKEHLTELPDLIDLLHDRHERFLLFSVEADDASFKSLKAVLEGSIVAPPDNVLIYATSNRRHLLPEFQRENQASQLVDGEIHPGETTEEKISLSERFGLWLSFYPFTQDQYLQIVDHWLTRLKVTDTRDEATRKHALQWATQRGSRSGRVARQFAIDGAGRR